MRNVYSDPTANTAIANVMREQHRLKKRRDEHKQCSTSTETPSLPHQENSDTRDGDWRLGWTSMKKPID